MYAPLPLSIFRFSSALAKATADKKGLIPRSPARVSSVTFAGRKMKRIDHVLFQADTDFIAYFDAQPLPGGDFGIEPCSCFGHFIAGQARQKKDVSRSLSVVEEVLSGGGLNADQLRSSFFPALNVALKEDGVRAQVELKLGPLSTEVWTRLRKNNSHSVI